MQRSGDELIHQYHEKTLDITANNIELYESGKKAGTSSGTGRLFVNASSQLQMTVEWRRRASRRQVTLGVWRDADRLEATLSDGHHLMAYVTLLQGREDMRTSTEHALFRVDHARLSKPLHNAQHLSDIQNFTFATISGNIPTTILTECSHITDDNPWFGEETISRDWFTFSTAAGEAAIRQHVPHNEIKLNTTWDEQGIKRLLPAITRALSFVLGERVDLFASSFTSPCDEVVFLHLHPEQHQATQFYRPIPIDDLSDPQSGTNLLQLATGYFLQEETGPVSAFLSLCWAALEQHLRELVVSTALEGIAAHTIGKSQRDEGFDRLKRRALHYLKENVEIRSDPSFARVEKILTGAATRSGRDTIRAAADKLGVAITKLELESWTYIRNSVAHGHHERPLLTEQDLTEAQERLDKYFKVVTAMNKLILGLMKYEGRIWNYGTRGFQASQPLEWLTGRSGSRYQNAGL